jgi:hypothetical protein
MKISLPIIVTAVACIAGCASAPTKVPYDTSKEARIRVIHGVGVFLNPESTCYGENVPGRIHAAAGGFSMLAPNKKIGMPVADDTPRSYHEYVTPAGRPLTVEMMYAISNMGGWSNTCGPIGATFTPAPGKDYETWMHIGGGRCKIEVRELEEIAPGKVKGTSVDLLYAPPCPTD